MNRGFGRLCHKDPVGKTAGRMEKHKGGLKHTDINFMVVRGTGKVRRFKISSRLLIFSSLFFLAFIIVGVFAINRYLALRLRMEDQKRKIETLENELTKVNHRLYEAEQRMVLLEHPVVRPARAVQREATQQSQVKTPKKEEPQRKNTLAGAAETVQADEAKEHPVREPGTTQLVDIKDLKMKVTPSSLDLGFKVYNVSSEPGPVRGYVHMIWIQDRSDMSRAWSYPNIKVRDGLPSDYKTGRLFSIRRFREIRASFERKPNMAIPRTLRIVAFDKSGKKVFLKDYDIQELVSGKDVSLKGKSTKDHGVRGGQKQPAEKSPIPQSHKALLSG